MITVLKHDNNIKVMCTGSELIDVVKAKEIVHIITRIRSKSYRINEVKIDDIHSHLYTIEGRHHLKEYIKQLKQNHFIKP